MGLWRGVDVGRLTIPASGQQYRRSCSSPALPVEVTKFPNMRIMRDVRVRARPSAESCAAAPAVCRWSVARLAGCPSIVGGFLRLWRVVDVGRLTIPASGQQYRRGCASLERRGYVASPLPASSQRYRRGCGPPLMNLRYR